MDNWKKFFVSICVIRIPKLTNHR